MAKAIPIHTRGVFSDFPAPAENFIECGLNLNTQLISHPAATFFVRVKGSSMMQSGICHGDILIVDRAIKTVSGTIVIAIVHGELVLKRLKIFNKRTFLITENELLPSVEITDNEEFTIWGVVTWVIHQAKL